MKYLYHFCFVFILCLLVTDFSRAQNLNENVSEQSLKATDTITSNNELSEDLIAIQNQNALISALIERQTQISRLAAYYNNMGVFYTQPKPSLSICESIPQNLLCLLHYPELDANKEAAEMIRASLEKRISDNMMQALQGYPLTGDGVTNPSVNVYQTSNFEWDDIQCFLGACSALIIPSGSDTRRYRVKEGDIIANDIKVLSITPTDVIISKGSEEITLKPVNVSSQLDGLDDSADITSHSNVSDILDRQLNNDEADEPSDISLSREQQRAGNLTATEELSTQPTQMLGPTGLF